MQDFLSEASFWVPEFLATSAWVEHAPFAFWLLDVHRPDVLVELGTHNGFSYLAFNQALKRLGTKSRSFAVDTWRGDEHSGLYGEEVFQELHAYNSEKYRDFSELIRATFDESVQRFEDETIDLLHIDGRHFYSDVKHDFETWKPKLSERGVVLFHDTNVRVSDFGVYRLWHELSEQYPHFEFLHGHGLGVLGFGSTLPARLKALFEAGSNPDMMRQIREAYVRLGQAVLDRITASGVTTWQTSELAKLSGEKQLLIGEQAKLQNDYRELRSRYEALGSALEESRQAREQERIDLLSRYNELKLQLEKENDRNRQIENEFREMKEQYGRLQEREERERSENEQLRKEYKSLTENLKQKEAISTELSRDLSSLRSTLLRVSADRDRYATEAGRQAIELRAVTCSRSWRLSAPLRRVSRTVNPKKTRLLLPLRVFWWVLTLQLRARMRLRAEKKLLAETRLFDRDFYLRHNPDVALRQNDPLEHYLTTGAKEGRNPNPLFDTGWYLAQNPDVAIRGVNPLVHYLQTGWKEGRNPGPLFDTSFYLANNPDIANAGMEPLGHFLDKGGSEARSPHPLFDTALYIESDPGLAKAGANPLLHYLESGWLEGRDPHSVFATTFYLENNADVAQAGTNPLLHYVQTGWAEKRDPHPLFDAAFYLERNPDIAAALTNPLIHYLRLGGLENRDPHPLFDTAFYLERNPDVAQSGINPLLHFLRSGWLEKRDPHPLFNVAFYLQRNPDVAATGTNPLLHYLESGWREGRDPHPLFSTAFYLQRNPDVAATGKNPLLHYVRTGWLERRDPHPLFDTNFYLEHNPDTAKAAINPLLHYLQSGWLEKRRPHPLFDTVWYLQSNRDVADSGANPLLHYVLSGWRERRSPGPFFDGGFYLDTYPDVAAGTASSLEHYLLFGAAEGRDPSRIFDTDWYSMLNRDVLASGINPLVHYALFGQAEKRRARPLVKPQPVVSPAASRNAIPRVVFISGEDQTPGHRYRVLRIAETLPRSLFDTVIIGLSEIQTKLAEIEKADVLWIWRAVLSEDLAAAMASARRRGAKILFDVDDLMFLPELGSAEIIDGIRSHNFIEEQVQGLFLSIQNTLLHADYCTVPTESLAHEARQLFKPAVVIPNGFNRSSFDLSRTAREARAAEQNDGLVRIGYASGSLTHQRDFGLIAPALATVLSENPSARLVLFRKALLIEEFPELQRVQSQIEWRDLVPVEQLPLELARFDINVAPLEVGNRFCEAKSELKFFEAALVGVPTVASPTRPFADAIRNGETGFLANTDDEWYNCLTRLVRDCKLRQEMAAKACREVLWLYGPERRAQLVTRVVNRLLASPPVNAELFALEVQLEDDPKIPEVAIPDHDVLLQSSRSGESRVSVIIPVFNYAHYLEAALESVRSQTSRNLDLIVIDDQSTDNSVAVARTWLKDHASDFNRVALLQNRRNSKLGAARNAGVSFSDTELFFPLDPDNLLLPDCIEKCLARLDETGAAYVYPTIEVFGDRAHEMGLIEYEPGRFQTGNYIDAMALVRKAAWIAVGGYSPLDPPGYEDFDFWAKLAEKGLFGQRLPEVTARYRSHGSSMLVTMTDLPENKKRVIREINARHPWLRRPDPDGDKCASSKQPQSIHASAAANGTSGAKGLAGDGIARILPILRCPETSEKLRADGDALISETTGRRWPVVKGRPVFTAEGGNVVVQSETHLSNELPPAVIALFEQTPGLVLNLSAGGTAKRYPNVVEMEYTIFRHTDAVGDVHRLPFQDEVFDAVVCLNAFEHYREPDVAMQEIRRVLKPGGRFFMHTAFLQPLHEAPHHYYNCTEFGLRHWLRHFQIECVRVSPNFNPAYTLSWLASETEAAFAGTISAQTAAAVGDARLRELAMFWRDPASRNSPLWNYFYELPPSAQHKLAAGWEAVATKA